MVWLPVLLFSIGKLVSLLIVTGGKGSFSLFPMNEILKYNIAEHHDLISCKKKKDKSGLGVLFACLHLAYMRKNHNGCSGFFFSSLFYRKVNQ